ncbi:hypothetical protein INS49_003947 [Diaporthe citri]|uniref:uncharacterized protein n=1 Tax=Diaporthe citri TaxID=83186 RepID=UPI001C7E84DD|nr:uncharacterized protein INS49_003947 [Diaporthe citri]KAG6354866.1 hypothetical protein INS49_003947 [Diaporthe citri]
MNNEQDDNINEFLEEIQNRRKLPRSLPQALKNLQEADEVTTERIFYDYGGVPAWTAYVLVKRATESTGHVSGRGKRRRLLDRIEEQSIESRQSLAERLGARIEPVQQQRFQRASQPASSSRGNERELLCAEGTGDDQLARESSQQSEIRSTGPDSTTSQLTPQQTPRLVPFATTHGFTSSISASTSAGVLNPIEFFSEERHVLKYASIAECASIFPPYLARAIVRRTLPHNSGTLGAAISMALPFQGFTKCLVRIEVTSSKVEHIAQELFGAQLETEHGVRYLYQPNGQKITPYPRLLLRECRLDNIGSFFGSELADAIFATPVYQMDIQKRNGYTSCVSMAISSVADESADIFILLWPKEGMALRDRLYT